MIMPIKMVMQLLNSLNKSQENRILGFISVLSGGGAHSHCCNFVVVEVLLNRLYKLNSV